MNHANIDKYESFSGVPAMTSPQVHEYLEELGASWTGPGLAMELGCWLGASSLALLKGLVKAGYNKPYWAFDAWRATHDQLPKAKAQGVTLQLGQSTLPLFLNNVTEVYKDIKPCQGNLPSTLGSYTGDPIEFVLFDAPKANPTFKMCIDKLRPHWVEGKTVLGLLDYNFYLRHHGLKWKKFRAPVEFMEQHKNHFEIEKQWENECVVFFRYVKKF